MGWCRCLVRNSAVTAANSSKYKMKYQSNTTKLCYVYYCIKATYFDSYRILIESSSGPSKNKNDFIRIETCCPNTIINIIKFCCFLIIYVLNTSGWQTLKKNNSSKVIVYFLILPRQKIVAATIASFQILSSSSFSIIYAL